MLKITKENDRAKVQYRWEIRLLAIGFLLGLSVVALIVLILSFNYA